MDDTERLDVQRIWVYLAAASYVIVCWYGIFVLACELWKKIC
ncbi:hypothetical protein AB0L06_21270 [Spirillospora sp. NPDC052269]